MNYKLTIGGLFMAISACLLCNTSVAQGQPPQLPKVFEGMSFNGGIGLAWFHGDLADYDLFPRASERDALRVGWHLSVEREMFRGIGAKLQFENGSLTGGRLPGKQSLPVEFKTNYNQISLRANYDIFETMFNKTSSKKRYSVDGEVGIGMVIWRSYSNWVGEDERIRDFVGYTVTDENAPTQRYTANSKTAPATAISIPIGISAGYMLNYKTDIKLSYSITHVFSDQLDTWSRDWTAQDKYSYLSIGLRYNLGRTPEDMPAKKQKKRNKKKEKNADQSNVAPKKITLPFPITARKSSPNFKKQTEKELGLLKLEILQLQMQLLEQEYRQK